VLSQFGSRFRLLFLQYEAQTRYLTAIGRDRPDGGGLLTAIVGVIKSGMAKARALR
jgi:hypothetical protein